MAAQIYKAEYSYTFCINIISYSGNVPGLGLFGLLYVNKLLDYILSLNYNLSANPLTLMHKEYMSGANFRV